MWILIMVIFYTGSERSPSITSVPNFKSSEACEKAAVSAKHYLVKSGYESYNILSTVCVSDK